MRRGALSLAAALLALTGCGTQGARERERQNEAGVEADTVDIVQTVSRLPPGTTAMAQRTAVLRLLNKRNGQMREFTMRPGQAIRFGDAIVRLRACETTAPWEVQRLTGAFVQLDIRNPQGQLQRVFSGWLYAETPSLNVVEHPIYDVWPRSCAMTHPGGGTPAPEGRDSSSRSSASNSTATAGEAAVAPAAPAPVVGTAPPSAESNSAR